MHELGRRWPRCDLPPNTPSARACCAGDWRLVSSPRCCQIRCVSVSTSVPKALVEGAELEILETPGCAVCLGCGDSVLLAVPFDRCGCDGAAYSRQRGAAREGHGDCLMCTTCGCGSDAITISGSVPYDDHQARDHDAYGHHRRR